MACTLEVEGEIATVRATLVELGSRDFHDLFDQPEHSGEAATAPASAVAWLSDRLSEELTTSARELLGDGVEVRVQLERGSLEVIAVLLAIGKLVIEVGSLLGALRELRALVPDRARGAVAGMVTGRVAVESTDVILGAGGLAAQVAGGAAAAAPATGLSSQDLWRLAATAVVTLAVTVGLVILGVAVLLA